LILGNREIQGLIGNLVRIQNGPATVSRERLTTKPLGNWEGGDKHWSTSQETCLNVDGDIPSKERRYSIREKILVNMIFYLVLRQGFFIGSSDALLAVSGA